MSFTGTARFNVLDKLGEGGMGVVYEVYDRDRGMRVALKTLRQVDAMSLYLFKREFRALSDLSHPNIIALYELVSEGDAWFLTMEVVEGADFIEYVRAGRTVSPAPMPPADTLCQPAPTDAEEAAAESTTGVTRTTGKPVPSEPGAQPQNEWVPPESRPHIGDIVDLARLQTALCQLAGALYALHSAGLVHRDLKPSNVRITGQHRVVLMDFGIVAELGAAPAIAADELAVGTPAFMAPEQIRGQAPSAAADWYAFGVLIYLALTGRLPYRGRRAQVLQAKQHWEPPPIHDLVRGAPPALANLCMELLARDPEQRPSGAEILARLGVAEPAAPTALQSDTGCFVGRQQELDELHRAYAEILRGGTACMLICAASGMGKTALLDHFLAQIAESAVQEASPGSSAGQPGEPVSQPLGQPIGQPLILAGRCHQRESLVYKALDGVIDSLSVYLAGLSAAERQALIPEDAVVLTRLFPVFCRVPECNVATLLEGHPLAELRARAITALRQLITALANRQPVVMRIEDLQWADRDSHELLLELFRPPAPARLLVLATMRPHGLQPLATHAAVGSACTDQQPAWVEPLERSGVYRRLILGPLSEDEQRELLMQLDHFRALSAHVSESVWRESAGHPMLLAELARYAWEAPAELEPIGAVHLEDVIWRRVSLMPAPARALAEHVALAGEPVPLRVLAEAAALAGNERERAATALIAAQLVRVTQTDRHEPWLHVYHDKVGEAIRERLPAARVRRLHQAIARALTHWPAALPATIASHWEAAGEPMHAATYLIAAADDAARVLAVERAAWLYRRVLALVPHGVPDGVSDGVSDGVTTDATTGATNRMSGRDAARLRCQAWIGLVKSARAAGSDTGELMGLIEQAIEAATAHELTEELAVSQYLRGSLLFVRGDLEGCLAAHGRARSLARRVGSAEGEARALSGLGDAEILSGRIATAHANYDACIEICRRHGFTDLEAATLAMRGTTSLYLHQLAAGLSDCTSAAAMAAAVRSYRAELIARCGGMILILSEMGNLDQAEHENQRGIELVRLVGARRFHAHTLANQGRLLAQRGQRGEALAVLHQALEQCREHGYALMAPLVLGVLAQVADDRDMARRALAEGEQLMRSGSRSPGYLQFCRDALEAALALEDAALVEHHARLMEDYTRLAPLPWSRFFAARARALVAYQRGERSPELMAELGRLRAQARASGLVTAEQALAAVLAGG